MAHFICTGDCNGVSETPGTCQAPDCQQYSQALAECHCEDGMHGKESTEEAPLDA